MEIGLVYHKIEASQGVYVLIAEIHVTDNTLIDFESSVPDNFELLFGEKLSPNASAVGLVKNGIPLLLKNLI